MSDEAKDGSTPEVKLDAAGGFMPDPPPPSMTAEEAGVPAEGADGEIQIANTMPDGSVHRLEDVKSISGKVTHATIPREAMGMGDPHLLGMIGAFIGGFGVVFTIASSAVFAIIAAVLGRIGLGRPLPYGPFLLLGGLAWIFGGWKLWQLYVDWLSFR